MHTNYHNPILQQLRDQQVRFAPREKKLEQVDRAEQLLGEIREERIYTYEYLCFRVTDFRPTSFAHSQISGADAAHDLRLLVEDLSDAANVPVHAAGEQVYTVNDLCSKYRVSSKTISRWRQMGLVSRRFVFDGRKRVGFLQSSVERFVKRNTGRVRRGMAFQRLTDEQREEIISRARRMARAGGSVTEISDRIAKRVDRSPETVRATLRDFDKENPDLAIFPKPNAPLNEEAKAKIYQQYRRGTGVEALAKMFSRTRSTIYRTVNEMRAKRIAELPLEYMPNPVFTRRNADKVCLGPMPEADTPPRKVRRPSGLPPYLASLYENPLLTREQEAHIFRKFNYLKYKAAKLRKRLSKSAPKIALMEEIETLYEQAVATKNEIVRANLRLVVSIAKRHIDQHENFFELVSDGNMSLLRAVEKFDFARGN
ncbi:MAG: RNA polymerase subunit sigma-70, partial [Planctomycetales bacterium]|nr:RNA polymerase subunit sigma-70 [Planctomycetales bacterium]